MAAIRTEEHSAYTFYHPLPDWGLPLFPYKPGFQVDITTHVPGPPFGKAYLSPQVNYVPEEDLLNIPISDMVFKHHPPETSSPDIVKHARLEIKSYVNAGRLRTSQIVACTIYPKDTEERPFEAVAKIFDPMYYPLDFLPRCPRDSVALADSAYTREAAAYQLLEERGLTGDVVPDYFGCWYFTLDDSDSYRVSRKRGSRPVRLILTEHLDGEVMDDLIRPRAYGDPDYFNPDQLTEKYRSDIMVRVFRILQQFELAGFEHRDKHPKNVMIVPGPDRLSEPEPRRLVFFNFDDSIIWSMADPKDGIPTTPAKKPTHPVSDKWVQGWNYFGAWLPGWWYDDVEKRNEWLFERFPEDESHVDQDEAKCLLEFYLSVQESDARRK